MCAETKNVLASVRWFRSRPKFYYPIWIQWPEEKVLKVSPIFWPCLNAKIMHNRLGVLIWAIKACGNSVNGLWLLHTSISKFVTHTCVQSLNRSSGPIGSNLVFPKQSWLTKCSKLIKDLPPKKLTLRGEKMPEISIWKYQRNKAHFPYSAHFRTGSQSSIGQRRREKK